MTPCNNQQQLEAYFEGHLPNGALGKFEEHLANCPQCQQSLALMNSAKDAIALAAAHRPVPENAAALTHSIMARVQASNDRSWWRVKLPAIIWPFNALRLGFGLASLALLALFTYQQSIIAQKLDSLHGSLPPSYTITSPALGNAQGIGGTAQAVSLQKIQKLKRQLERGQINEREVQSIVSRLEALELERTEILTLLQADPTLAEAVRQCLDNKGTNEL